MVQTALTLRSPEKWGISQFLFQQKVKGRGVAPTYKSESVSCSVVSDSLRPHGLLPARLLWPWDSSGKNTGVGCHSLLQGVFWAEGSNPGLLYWRQILYSLRHRGAPLTKRWELGFVTSEKQKGKNTTTLMRKVPKRTKSFLKLCLSVWHPLPNIFC